MTRGRSRLKARPQISVYRRWFHVSRTVLPSAPFSFVDCTLLPSSGKSYDRTAETTAKPQKPEEDQSGSKQACFSCQIVSTVIYCHPLLMFVKASSVSSHLYIITDIIPETFVMLHEYNFAS